MEVGPDGLASPQDIFDNGRDENSRGAKINAPLKLVSEKPALNLDRWRICKKNGFPNKYFCDGCVFVLRVFAL